MEKLPLELLENILSDKTLSIVDVHNFSATSKYFRDAIINSTAIWKHKFHATWPQFKTLFDRSYTDFREEIQHIYDLKRRTAAILYTMSPRLYKKYQLSDSDFAEFDKLLQEREKTYDYLLLILAEILEADEPIKSIEVVPLHLPGNKTTQYYARKTLEFIKQRHLTKVWRHYASLPAKEQTLEKGATFVAQWCQRDVDISEAKIAAELDLIANQVKVQLMAMFPDHPLFKASREDLERWKTENLDKNQWNVQDCRRLMQAMREVIYQQLGFNGDSDTYYNPKNSLINQVLENKKGLPILLAIIFESVGRRLGLHFEPINFPSHFLLRFTETGLRGPSVFYVDTFNGGDMMQRTVCPYTGRPPPEELFPVASPILVVERVANNLEVSTRQHIEPNGRVHFLRAVLELLKLVNRQDLTALTNLAEFYNFHKIDTGPLEEFLQTEEFEAPERVVSIVAMVQDHGRRHFNELLHKENQVLQRTKELKYAVGLVMKDITRNDKCVIYGWHPGCPSAADYPLIIEGPYVQYPVRSKKPSYSVLVEDGSYRYVTQDMIVPSWEVSWYLLNNKDLGRHFSHFFGNHFVPNAEKEKEYPFDKKIRHKHYQSMQQHLFRP